MSAPFMATCGTGVGATWELCGSLWEQLVWELVEQLVGAFESTFVGALCQRPLSAPFLATRRVVWELARRAVFKSQQVG